MSKRTRKRNEERQRRVHGWTQWKEPQARAALAEWQRSGLSASAFCAREGYSPTRLRYWSERLESPAARPAEAVSFVPVELALAHEVSRMEIEHRGVVLRVREDLDVGHVARLVLALASAEPTC